MKPITRKEYYLAKAAGTYTGPTPAPVLREDYYLATLAGDYSGNCPAPVTRLEKYMSAAAGLTSYVPQPVTRVEKYWYAIAKGTGYVPEPVTREERFLYALVPNKPGPPKPEYVDKTAEGNPILLTDSAEAPLTALTVYGHSTQDGTPSPENPVPIVSAGDSGEIEAKVYGGNLISSDISSWNSDGWAGSDSMLQLSDGIKIKAINGWTKVYYDTSEMNGKTLNLSFDYQQIESETTSPSAENAFAIAVQNENVYPSIDTFTFRTDSPETVKTHVSGSFIARNYLCFFLRVNTEGLTEEPETRTIEITNIMLNAGDTELTYEPYKTPQTFSLSTPNGLPGIPVSSGGNYTDENGQQWVCDEIDLARGKYVQRVGKTVVDGTEIKFTATSAGDYWNLPYQSAPGVLEQSIGMSKYFPTGMFLGNAIYSFLFTMPKLISPYFSLIDELNAFCAEKYADGQPLEIYYIMAPIETDLPAEEIAAYKALHTYNPTTTVSNDAEARMKVGYKATS